MAMANDIIKIILRKQILELLNTIHKKYPDKFKKTVIQKELETILKNIDYYKPLNKSNISLATSLTPHKLHKKNKKNIDKSERCNARVWNNIFERKTLKSITEIDKKFCVSDFNNLKIKEFHEKYIIGSQCSRRIVNSSKYCNQHSHHNPHGNYLEIPSPELCFHYLQVGNYI